MNFCLLSWLDKTPFGLKYHAANEMHCSPNIATSSSHMFTYFGADATLQSCQIFSLRRRNTWKLFEVFEDPLQYHDVFLQ